MKFVVAEFHQESNSFNPVSYKMADFERSGIYEGSEMIARLSDKPCALAGMLHTLSEAGAEAVPGCSMFSQSGGPVEHEAAEYFIRKTTALIEACAPVDGVLLSLHGATETTERQDCSGYMLETVRKAAGEGAVIAVSTDMHANITSAMMRHADVICGYHTYPHSDHYETGRRTAALALSCLKDEARPVMARVAVPMIVPASAYSTLDGPFADLTEYGKRMISEGGALDFSIYQMQPWLDVEEAGSSVVVIGRDAKAAKTLALDLARRLYALRGLFIPSLHTIDEVIGIAAESKSGKPVVLVDSADSSNAGATGDSAAVIRRLLELGSDLKAACIVTDAPATEQAHRIGVGQRAVFSLGGALYPEMNPPLRVEAYVKSLHDGVFAQEGPAGRGLIHRIGPAAVLQIGAIDVLVCRHIAGNGDPQLYRAFGIEPAFYRLVLVKACTSHKAAYRLIADRMCETETPGAADQRLESLPFKRVPRTFYPFTREDNFDERAVTYGRGQGQV